MKRCFIHGDPGGVYSAPWDIPGGSENDAVALTKSDCRVIYDIYDDLTTRYPQYATGTVMGTVGSYDWKRYTFRYPEPENTSPFSPRRLKIVIVTSIHGYEQGCAWTTAQFFRQLCQGQDPLLAFLRRSVVFEVIPVANPWGFSHNARKNANGVDLNRNFEPYFLHRDDPDSKEYGGEQPCSEAETRMLMQFIQENRDAAVVLDYHNIGRGNPLFYVYGERDASLADCVFGALTDKWKQEYSQLAQAETLGRLKPNGGEGMFADYLIQEGLWVLTVETPWCMPEIGKAKYDAATIRCSLDVLVNTILAVVRAAD